MTCICLNQVFADKYHKRATSVSNLFICKLMVLSSGRLMVILSQPPNVAQTHQCKFPLQRRLVHPYIPIYATPATHVWYRDGDVVASFSAGFFFTTTYISHELSCSTTPKRFQLTNTHFKKHPYSWINFSFNWNVEVLII